METFEHSKNKSASTHEIELMYNPIYTSEFAALLVMVLRHDIVCCLAENHGLEYRRLANSKELKEAEIS